MFFQRAQSPHPSRLGGIQIFSDSEGRFLLFPVIRSRSGSSHILAAVETLSTPLTAPELGTALLALWDRWEGTPCWEELPPEPPQESVPPADTADPIIPQDGPLYTDADDWQRYFKWEDDDE